LSDRLTTQNGVMLMGAAAIAALWYTKGDVTSIVVMYSINVFVTFSLSMLGMLGWCVRAPDVPRRKRGITLFTVGSVLCVTILAVTIIEKFGQGGWITLLVTGALVAVCFATRSHYDHVLQYLRHLDADLDRVPAPEHNTNLEFAPDKPTAVVLVGGYGGLGIHTVLNIFRTFPGHFGNLVFVSVGVTDSGQFKGAAEMKALQESTVAQLERFVELARRLGVPASHRWSIGTDVVDEAERLCMEARNEFRRTVFFAGQVVFALEKWYHRLLHNQTAFAVQKRLQLKGIPMVILPVRIRVEKRGQAPRNAH
jgi:hypothetical protein